MVSLGFSCCNCLYTFSFLFVVPFWIRVSGSRFKGLARGFNRLIEW